MKAVKKFVYYCDYCKKRGLSKYGMHKHELHCTMNPDRHCRMCEGNDIRKIVEEYKTRFKLSTSDADINEFGVNVGEIEVEWLSEPITIDDVRKRVDGCPNCMFAIIRQCNFNRYYFNTAGFGDFNYKAEFDAAMAEKNLAQSKEEYYLGLV